MLILREPGAPTATLLDGLHRYRLSLALEFKSKGFRLFSQSGRCVIQSTYTNGWSTACGSDFKLNAAAAEPMLLDYIETDLLSPEAIEFAVTEYRDQAKKLKAKSPGGRTPG